MGINGPKNVGNAGFNNPNRSTAVPSSTKGLREAFRGFAYSAADQIGDLFTSADADKPSSTQQGGRALMEWIAQKPFNDHRLDSPAGLTTLRNGLEKAGERTIGLG